MFADFQNTATANKFQRKNKNGKVQTQQAIDVKEKSLVRKCHKKLNRKLKHY